MRAKHNEHRTWDVGGTNAIHYAVREEFVPGLWESMLARLSDPRLALFRGMFIVLQTYGTKLVWNNSNFSTLRASVFADLDKSINRTYLVHEKTYFDVGKETVSKSARVHWWKTCCLQHWRASMDPKNHVAQRQYPVNGTRDAAAMNLAPTQRHFFHPHVVYAQRYSNYKELFDAGKVFPFTNLNIESILVPVNLLELWSKAGGSHGRSKHVEQLVIEAGKRSYANSKKRLDLAFRHSQAESFGSREKYRVLLEVFDGLNLDSQPSHRCEPRPYYSMPTTEALLFLRWDMNRWLSALDHLLNQQCQPTPSSGAMGTMLARVIKTISNDSASGHASDLYRDSYSSGQSSEWLGLGMEQIVKDTGLFWLKDSMFDWEQLKFYESIESRIRYFIPDSRRTYKERRRQVSNITRLYNGDWRICHTWRQRPTWAALIQQLFDWDDQHLYKTPFTRERWDNLQYRLVTRHGYSEISRSLGVDVANDWKSSLGTYGCQFFWMLPKCTASRFGAQGKKTVGSGATQSRTNQTSWYSASHAKFATSQTNQVLVRGIGRTKIYGIGKVGL